MEVWFWGRVKANQFWGRRAGTSHPSKGLVIIGKRGCQTRKGEHSGPSGYQLKKTRNYRNAKLKRKGLMS